MRIIEKISTKKIGLIFLFAFAFIMPVFSQPPPPPPTSSVGSPIEGGLIYLLAVGIGYGIKKITNLNRSTAA